MACAQPGIPHRKGDAQTSLGFGGTDGSHNLGQATRPSDSQKRTCQIFDFTVLVDLREKLKEIEKRDKY